MSKNEYNRTACCQAVKEENYILRLLYIKSVLKKKKNPESQEYMMNINRELEQYDEARLKRLEYIRTHMTIEER